MLPIAEAENGWRETQEGLWVPYSFLGGGWGWLCVLLASPAPEVSWHPKQGTQSWTKLDVTDYYFFSFFFLVNPHASGLMCMRVCVSHTHTNLQVTRLEEEAAININVKLCSMLQRSRMAGLHNIFSSARVDVLRSASTIIENCSENKERTEM